MNCDLAIKKLVEGNNRYIKNSINGGDVSENARVNAVTSGQNPYAVIVTCSDSRVIPEAIFQAGIGDLFVIRVAGNVVGVNELASIEYAVEHLHTPLVVIMGHECCGAVASALSHKCGGYVQNITNEILRAAKQERDNEKVTKLNVLNGVNAVKTQLSSLNFKVVGAIYRMRSGLVEFLD